jgi:hypothetical protein
MARKTSDKNKTKKRKIVWFAKGGGISRMGPFPTQIRAAEAMTLMPAPASYNFHAGVVIPEVRPNTKPGDFATWPEYADA